MIALFVVRLHTNFAMQTEEFWASTKRDVDFVELQGVPTPKNVPFIYKQLSNPTTNKLPCPACKGKGAYFSPMALGKADLNGGSKDERGVVANVDLSCPQCKGAGHVVFSPPLRTLRQLEMYGEIKNFYEINAIIEEE